MHAVLCPALGPHFEGYGPAGMIPRTFRRQHLTKVVLSHSHGQGCWLQVRRSQAVSWSHSRCRAISQGRGGKASGSRRCPGVHIRGAGCRAGVSSPVAMALLWVLSCLALAGFARAALPEGAWGSGLGGAGSGLGARGGGSGGDGTRARGVRSRRPTAARVPQTAACPPSRRSSAATTASSAGSRPWQGPGRGRCPSR